MRAWRPDRQPAFYASPCRFESCRALCCPRGGRETMRASEARGAGSTPAGDADGGIGQRQAARPSTWKRWVRFPLPSPCSRSSLARSPGLQPDRVGSRRASLGANHRGRVWEGKRVGAPTRSPPIRIDGGSKPLGSTACPRSLMEQAPDYGSGSWGFESSRGCNGSGAGAQSRLIRGSHIPIGASPNGRAAVLQTADDRVGRDGLCPARTIAGGLEGEGGGPHPSPSRQQHAILFAPTMLA